MSCEQGPMDYQPRLGSGTLLDQGRFEVVRAIKTGGMGAVYEVADHRLAGKTFALKEMLQPGLEGGAQIEARQRFISEVEVMMRLRHPNIPRVSSSFLHGNSFYFVMELIRGQDLSQVLEQEGNPGLAPERVVGWGLQILSALEYLHGQSPAVVHRDIKPSNLLLEQASGRLLLIDFGISDATHPGEGLWIGTPGYAAPEQQLGRPEPRSDLFSLAASLHQLISGTRPVDFDQFADLSGDPELNRVLRWALKPWADERVPSASRFARALTELKNLQVVLPPPQCLDFEGAADDYKRQVLDPQLKSLITRYGNECQTRFLPHSLDYLQFVLASSTPHELQVSKDEKRAVVAFRCKQGLLESRWLGEIDPSAEDRWERTQEILGLYLQEYEESKGFGGVF